MCSSGVFSKRAMNKLAPKPAPPPPPTPAPAPAFKSQITGPVSSTLAVPPANTRYAGKALTINPMTS